MKLFQNQENKRSIIYLLRWISIALVSALVAAGVVRLFILLFTIISTTLLKIDVPVFIWPLAGALLTGGIIYRIAPKAAGEGMPSYISGLRDHGGFLPGKATIFKFPAAVITLSTFGAGGLIGPLGRVNSGIMSKLLSTAKFMKFDKYEQRTAAICGLAATIGVLTQSSIGAGIFAVEVIQRANLRYRDIFPAILASSTASIIAKSLNWTPFYPIEAAETLHSYSIIPAILVLSIAAGLIGKLYIFLYKKISSLFKREKGEYILLKVLIGSLAAALPAWLLHPDLIGGSRKLAGAVLEGNFEMLFQNLPSAIPIVLILVIFIIVKCFANCATVGSGMSAGFTAPAAVIGIFLGAAAANLLGLSAGSPEYDAMIAAGFASVIASVMNVPLAASIIAIELFGLHYGFAAGIAAVIGFQVNRHQTIYDLDYKNL